MGKMSSWDLTLRHIELQLVKLKKSVSNAPPASGKTLVYLSQGHSTSERALFASPDWVVQAPAGMWTLVGRDNFLQGNARDVNINRKSPRGHQVNGAAESPILSGVPVLSSLDLATSNIILVNEACSCDRTSLSHQCGQSDLTDIHGCFLTSPQTG